MSQNFFAHKTAVIDEGARIGAGKARIITSLDDMDKIAEGDVLVTDMTDPDWEPIMKMASAIGLEIARSIGEGVRSVLAPAAVDSAELDCIREEVQQAVSRISASSGDVDTLRSENAELKEKLRIMEAELVRIRKDRREMEKYLLDKIKTVTT